MYNENLIIAFEGMDGTGKTTQCNHLLRWMSENGYRCVYNKARVKPTFEYKLICDIETNNESFTKELKAGLIAYERCKQIYEALNNNHQKILIFDKYIYSTEIYLKYKSIDPQIAEMMLSWLPKPDLVLYFDLDVQESLSRIYKRNKAIGNNENAVFLEKLKKELPNKICSGNINVILLDASKDEKEVMQQIQDSIISNLNLSNYKEDS